jgi:hypothetical protein
MKRPRLQVLQVWRGHGQLKSSICLFELILLAVGRDLPIATSEIIVITFECVSRLVTCQQVGSGGSSPDCDQERLVMAQVLYR